MKKFYKISFIIAGCMVCIGLMFGCVGVVFGGSQQLVNMIENGELSYGDHWGFQWDDHDLSFDDYDDMDWENSQDGIVYDIDEIKNLNIKIGGGAMTIVPYDGDKIKIVTKNQNKYKCGLKGDTLYIQSNEESTNRRSIKLYFPQNMMFENVTVKLGAGVIDAESIDCDELKATVGAGQLSAEDITSKDAYFKIGAGSLMLSDINFIESEYKVGLGAADIDGKLLGNTEIDVSMGSVEMDLDNKEEDFNYQVDCSAGSVEIGDMSTSGMATERDFDNGSDSVFIVNCSMGSAAIDFQ
ncbi:MAG: DUF4097 family beta strand repeat-containing protein [Lachnospiraceae bacterium]|nr:DUF4097 family beta strand repeat-containing protein [Lachnospiraceae bacterium]